MRKRRKRVLVAGVGAGAAEWLKPLLDGAGYEAIVVVGAGAAEHALRAGLPDAVIADLVGSEDDGLDLVRRLRARRPEAELIVVSDRHDGAGAIDAVRAGASYFLERPVEQEGLLTLLEKAIEKRSLQEENAQLRKELHGRQRFEGLVGRSRQMLELFDLVERVATSDANVLIEGENGTGKELIANAIHYRSPRREGRFLKINCAALPKDLIESELFGYKRGAFTGALADKEGLLEGAHGGSVLLDEVGEMPAYLQTKLLRVLQERQYRPIGSDQIVQVDFRLICATNIDVSAALRDGKLREDLYFRINTITLRVPPLRERSEDIPLLCDHFLDQFRQRHGKNVRTLAPAVYHLLIRNRWAGNVRELENAIERALLVAKGSEITVADLPESIREETGGGGAFSIPANRTLAEIERMAILQTLERTNWNKQEAAAILGLYRPTLYSKMRKHDIRDPRKGGG